MLIEEIYKVLANCYSAEFYEVIRHILFSMIVC